MPSRNVLILLIASLVAVSGLLTSAVPVRAASTEQVLYSFCALSGCTDGGQPAGGLIFDGAGNLYGATIDGGAYGYGTVFELTPAAGGGWTETVLYSFCPNSGCGDGASPIGGLIFDAAGNLYGTTANGGIQGTPPCVYTSGCGTVFELSPAGNGTWTERVLHAFNDNGKDGFAPAPGLIFDSTGNLYGATSRGGPKSAVCSDGCGTVFKLKPNANGTWTETVLHSFCHVNGCAGDGIQPMAGLILGAGGSLYGTTYFGGASSKHCEFGCGIAFQLTPGANGKWSEKVLHSFNGDNGRGPQAGLILDASGNLYGTTELIGTVFELIKSAKGGWTEKVLHRFGKGEDGTNPDASLIFDAAGNLYSTTFGGGANTCLPNGGCGIVFQLSPQADGKWTENILHDFQSNGQDGTGPHASIIFDAAGNLYSTTGGGGTGPCENSLGEVVGCGIVFEITP
jgi:uncharacterized repeat protein (TIGR03803 family)